MEPVIEGEVVDEQTAITTLPPSAALEAISRSQISSMMHWAETHRRDLDKFRKEAMSMATADEATASSMFYTLTKGKKNIVGPSVRLAEVAVYCWKNVLADSQIVDETGDFVTSRGYCFDAERNTGVAVTVSRRIIDKYGNRYSTDVIQNTKNAANAIAFREAVFKVIPRLLLNPIFEQSKRVAVGKAETLVSKRQKMLDHFGKMHITPEMVLRVLDKKDVADIDLEDMVILKGIATSLKDGEATVESVFAVSAAKPAAATDITDRLKKQPAEPAKTEPAKTETTVVAPPIGIISHPAAEDFGKFLDEMGAKAPTDRFANRSALRKYFGAYQSKSPAERIEALNAAAAGTFDFGVNSAGNG